VLREMYSRYRDRYRAWHPRGVGFLEEPVGKSPGSGVRRHPGDEFLHAHALLRIDDDCLRPPTPEELDSFVEVMFNSELDGSNVVRFERLIGRDVLRAMWLDQNPDADRLHANSRSTRPLDPARGRAGPAERSSGLAVAAGRWPPVPGLDPSSCSLRPFNVPSQGSPFDVVFSDTSDM
jgi:hypothetical protein